MELSLCFIVRAFGFISFVVNNLFEWPIMYVGDVVLNLKCYLFIFHQNCEYIQCFIREHIR